MVTRLATGATLFSVGKEPNGTPTGVMNLGGGPHSSYSCCASRQRTLAAG